MKKLSTLFLALCAVMAVNAELLMHETFPTPGQLDAGYVAYNATNNPVKIDTVPGYLSKWWSYNTPPSKTNKPSFWLTPVTADHGMSYPGYASEVAGGAMHVAYDAAETVSTGHYTSNDLHFIEGATNNVGDRIYVSFLMNLEEKYPSMTSASWQNILALGTDSSANNNYAYLSVYLDPNNNDGYRFGVEKKSDESFLGYFVDKKNTTAGSNLNGKVPSEEYSLTGYKSPIYNFGETYLVVMEYIYVDNALLEAGQLGNDSINIYINPTLNSKVPVAHSASCKETITNASTGAVTTKWYGRVAKADPAKAFRTLKFKSAKNLQSVYYDQIKVATAWEDLFEGSLADPAVDVNTHEITKYVVSGGGFSDSIVVTALNLEDDLAIEPADENTVLEVEDDEFDADDEDLATGVTVHFGASGLTENGTDTLIVYSGSAVQKVAVNWVVIPSVSTLAEVHDTVYYTGNAQLTYNALTHSASGTDYRLITLQDESGAIAVDQLDGFAVGDVVTNVVLMGSKKAAVQTAHPGLVYKVSSAEHSDVAYEVKPLVVKPGNVNLAEHLYKLIELDTVGLSGMSNTFSNLSIARNSVSGVSNFYVLTPSGNTLLNTPIPATANVVGVVNGIAQTVIDPNSAVWKFICPRGVEDVEEVVKRTLNFDEKTVKIEGTMYVDSTYTATMLLKGSNLIQTVVLTAEGVTLESYELTPDSVNGGAEVTITVAPLEADSSWTGSVTATCGDLTATLTLSGIVIARTLEFSVETVDMGTMYVDSVYTLTVQLNGSNLTDSVELVAVEHVSLDSYKLSADSVNGGATVTITIAPLAEDAEWNGTVVAAYGSLMSTLNLTGVVAKATPTAIDNVATKARAVKVIRDGQLRIVRGEDEFSVLGEPVK